MGKRMATSERTFKQFISLLFPHFGEKTRENFYLINVLSDRGRILHIVVVVVNQVLNFEV